MNLLDILLPTTPAPQSAAARSVRLLGGREEAPKPPRIVLSPEERRERNRARRAIWRRENADRKREYDRKRLARDRELINARAREKRREKRARITMTTLHRTFVLREPHHVAGLGAFLKQNWRAFADQGKPLEVVVSQAKAKRSVEQNARLHAILTEIADQAWVRGRQYDAETWKTFFKMRFIGSEEITLPDGRVIEQAISTTTLDVAAFNDLMTQIEQHATQELGVRFHV